MDNLLGVLVGGIIAAVAGVIGHRLSKLTEQEQWLRNRKLDTYLGLIDALQRVYRDSVSQHDASKLGPLTPQPMTTYAEWAREVHQYLSRMSLLAPLSLIDHATNTHREVLSLNRASREGDFETAYKSATRALGRLEAEARIDLGVSDYGASSSSMDRLIRFANRNLGRH